MSKYFGVVYTATSHGASTAGVDLFLTNDKRLHNARVDGIHFITSVSRAPV